MGVRPGLRCLRAEEWLTGQAALEFAAQYLAARAAVKWLATAEELGKYTSHPVQGQRNTIFSGEQSTTVALRVLATLVLQISIIIGRNEMLFDEELL